MDNIDREFKGLALTGSTSDVAVRPDQGGKLGRPIELRANVYPVVFTKEFKVYHYDINITPVGSVKASSKPGRAAEVERALPAGLCRDVWNRFSTLDKYADFAQKAAFDGRKSAFCSIPFPFSTMAPSENILVTLQPHTDEENARLREFNIRLSAAQEIDMQVLQQFIKRATGSAELEDKVATAIQACDILLKHDVARKPNCIVASRGQKYFNSASGTDISLGAHVLKGFFQSVRPTMAGLCVNLDTAYSPYIKDGDLRTVMFAILGRDGAGSGGRGGRGGPRGAMRGGRGGMAPSAPGRVNMSAFTRDELRELKSKLKGSTVRVTHRTTRQTFAIEGFGSCPADHYIDIGGKKGEGFSAVQIARAAAAGQRLPTDRPTDGQRRLTLAAYFKERYNFVSEYPDLQCVELRGGSFVPIECLVLLPGKALPPHKLNPDQAASMIKVAAKNPIDRRNEIQNVRSNIVKYEVNQRILDGWGMKISNEMAKVSGRVLPPPRVQYKGAPINAQNGQWNMLQSKMYTPGHPLKHWAVINFARNLSKPSTEAFIQTWCQVAANRGMIIENKQPVMERGFDRQPVESLRAACRAVMEQPNNPTKSPPQIIFAIMEDRKIYEEFKRAAFFDLPVPIVTQAMMANKLSNPKGLDQYCTNLCLKINVKLHGANWILGDLPPRCDPHTIILGADVTHPPPGTKTAATSVAACVATTNDTFSQYGCQIREQPGRQEVISDLEDMVFNLIRKWKGSKGQKPANLVFFRDGVGEGQYKIVVDHEIAAVKAACRRIDARHPWKLTYVICAKRHHLRFFPERAEDVARDRSGNLPAGTVVDSTVTHPYLFDFYLQAHSGLVGTARPTHYVTLLDEIKFSSDNMEALVNALSYTFVRATRSVSLVPVAYYADIVCTKARSYVYDDSDETSTTVSGASGSAKPFDPKRIQNRLDKTAPGYSYPTMWFM